MTTAADLREWIKDHHVRHAKRVVRTAPGELVTRTFAEIADELDEVDARCGAAAGLRRRVVQFIRVVDHFAAPLAKDMNARGAIARRERHVRALYVILKAWVSTLVGYDAPESERVEYGYDVLLQYAIQKLEL